LGKPSVFYSQLIVYTVKVKFVFIAYEFLIFYLAGVFKLFNGNDMSLKQYSCEILYLGL